MKKLLLKRMKNMIFRRKKKNRVLLRLELSWKRPVFWRKIHKDKKLRKRRKNVEKVNTRETNFWRRLQRCKNHLVVSTYNLLWCHLLVLVCLQNRREGSRSCSIPVYCSLQENRQWYLHQRCWACRVQTLNPCLYSTASCFRWQKNWHSVTNDQK